MSHFLYTVFFKKQFSQLTSFLPKFVVVDRKILTTYISTTTRMRTKYANKNHCAGNIKISVHVWLFTTSKLLCFILTTVWYFKKLSKGVYDKGQITHKWIMPLCSKLVVGIVMLIIKVPLNWTLSKTFAPSVGQWY